MLWDIGFVSYPSSTKILPLRIYGGGEREDELVIADDGNHLKFLHQLCKTEIVKGLNIFYNWIIFLQRQIYETSRKKLEIRVSVTCEVAYF